MFVFRILLEAGLVKGVFFVIGHEEGTVVLMEGFGSDRFGNFI